MDTQAIKRFFGKRSTANILVCAYIVFSLLNVAAFFRWGYIDISYTLWGNHSIFYPFIGLLLAADMGSKTLMIFMFAYWPLSIVFLIVSLILVLTRRNYLLILLAVEIDVIFVLLFAVVNILWVGFLSLHLAMLIGAAMNLVFGLYLHWYRKGIMRA